MKRRPEVFLSPGQFNCSRQKSYLIGKKCCSSLFYVVLLSVQGQLVFANEATEAAIDPTHRVPSPEKIAHSIRDLDNASTSGLASQLHRSLQPCPIGARSVIPVLKEPSQALSFERPAEEKNQTVEVKAPQLNALISISRNLNPFSLDSDYEQDISLRDVLIAASGANLRVLETQCGLEARKWQYANSVTSFLPTIKLGLNEVWLNSKMQLPLKANGIARSGNGALVSLETPLTILSTGFNWTPIQGGRLLALCKSNKHGLRAAQARLTADISDALLAATDSYWDLLYNLAVLQIRLAAVATDEEQVKQNTNLAAQGMATKLDIMQARAQLAHDRQNLLDQQRLRRFAAMKLARVLNANLCQDLVPTDATLQRVRLVSSDIPVNTLVNTAIENRSELRQYEELRCAALQKIKIARADILPSLSLGGNIFGIASSLGSMRPSYLLNFCATWQFEGLGTATITNVRACRWQARQAMIQANECLANVLEQVRSSYNQTLTADRAIDEAGNELKAAKEELRLAQLRLKNGMGTYLEVLTAQRDLTRAEVDLALALVNFNKSQAQLLRDMGCITIENLTSGRVFYPHPTS